MIKIYGIKNCDTMKKTFQWLDDNAIAYDFHDYKKIGVDDEFLTRAIEQHGWETIINTDEGETSYDFNMAILDIDLDEVA